MGKVYILQRGILELEIIAYRMMQGIDDRIARDENGLRRNVFCQQIGLRRARRRKIEVGDAARQTAVHLLRERRILIVRAQTSLDVADSRLMVISRKCTGKCRRRISVNEHDIRFFLRQDLVKAHHSPRRDIKKRLASRHDVEIMIRLDMEEVEHLIEHFAVLGGNGHYRFNRLRVLLELQDNRSHLDGLRTRAEDSHDLDLLLFHYKTSLMP